MLAHAALPAPTVVGKLSNMVGGTKYKTMKEFGKTIKAMRERRGMTQRELAEWVGYGTPQFINIVETCKQGASPELLGKLVVLLGLNEEEIVESTMRDFERYFRDEIETGKRLAREKIKSRKLKP